MGNKKHIKIEAGRQFDGLDREVMAAAWRSHPRQAFLYQQLVHHCKHHSTGLLDTGLRAVQWCYQQVGIHVCDNTARNDLRKLREIGALGFDPEVNKHTRRYRLVVRTILIPRIADLIQSVRKLIGSMAGGKLQRENTPPIGSKTGSGIQRTPSGSVITKTGGLDLANYLANGGPLTPQALRAMYATA